MPSRANRVVKSSVRRSIARARSAGSAIGSAKLNRTRRLGEEKGACDHADDRNKKGERRDHRRGVAGENKPVEDRRQNRRPRRPDQENERKRGEQEPQRREHDWRRLADADLDCDERQTPDDRDAERGPDGHPVPPASPQLARNLHGRPRVRNRERFRSRPRGAPEALLLQKV